MDSVILCSAPEDEAPARRLAGFIETNLPFSVALEEGVAGQAVDLMEATERALSAEAALVLLSPFSVPRVWNRRVWESVFFEKPKELQTHLGFVLLAGCRFPELLRRQRFFDASSDALEAARAIKRWLLRPLHSVPAVSVRPELEDIRRAVADQPGAAIDIAPERAVEFAAGCSEDFEAVYRFDCRGRSRAGILGDICTALGLPCSGRLEQNRATWSEWCARHRVLFVLAGVTAEDRDWLSPGGLASVVFTSPLAGDLPRAVPSWAADAVRKLDRILRADFEAALRHGWITVNLLKEQRRFAEVQELLELMARSARGRGDANAVSRIEREQYWIAMDLGSGDSPTPGPAPWPVHDERQLTLPFGA
jgi:hypothetical protein